MVNLLLDFLGNQYPDSIFCYLLQHIWISFDVYWNQSDRIVYVDWGGRTDIGKANSASEAMVKAEAWLYNK